MDVRYFIDPETEQPHIFRHDVAEPDVEDVRRRPMEDRPGRDGSRVALGRSPAWSQGAESTSSAQSDEEAVAEDEAAYEATTHTAMEVPVELVPAVRELIAKGRAG